MLAPKILIIEGDKKTREFMDWALRGEFSVRAVADDEEGIVVVRDWNPIVVLLSFPANRGIHIVEKAVRFLREIRGDERQSKVIVFASALDLTYVSPLMSSGVYDLLLRPVDFNLLRSMLWRACWFARFEGENPPAPVSTVESHNEILGTSEKIREILASILKLAAVDVPVLITGESGTGKELVAKAIHDRSLRRHGPFVPINCGAIPENLLESELFGYERGAFTGAVGQRKGKFEYAHGGTLFLDEVGELPVQLQVKLLRFLEERIVERVGGRGRIKVDVRIVAAANRNLREAVLTGEFRDDLYYRLAVVPLELPPLRDRGADVIFLAKNFFRQAMTEYRRRLRGFSPEAVQAIQSYPWPGNVRELLNKVRRAVLMAEGLYLMPQDMDLPHAESKPTAPVSLKDARRRVERELLVSALARHDGNLQKVASDLKVSRPLVYYLLDTYGLRKPLRVSGPFS